MKILITLKDPDSMPDAVTEAFEFLPCWQVERPKPVVDAHALESRIQDLEWKLGDARNALKDTVIELMNHDDQPWCNRGARCGCTCCAPSLRGRSHDAA